MSNSVSGLKTVERAFEILELLKEKKEIGVAELAREMDIPKSTVHDYLRTLTSMGYAVNENGKYRLGFRLLEFGGQLKYRNRLFHIAKPELERIAEQTDEIVSVNVEDRGRFVILHAEHTSKSLQLGIYPGITIPIHTHAAGKVMLAGYDDGRVDEIIDQHGLTAVTEHTITDRDELEAELETIREQGYAVDWDQQVVGMGVVAAPVKVEDQVVGSIGIVTPTDHLRDEEYCAELASEVQKSANIVSVNYQYSP
ncbi:IclR family transcriptional regulator [Halogeometricum luteum]|uniref:IclR family transcriptional regulator n=1 Tax=Halogeometricum luteum TaxID=2950537 RepID=A0ABU2G684_9EURY|nr:IclR family transcriptional regulator [Halogeometricum sp. S3BR5-2]MDS0295719.1 IclR family transcriptional regulator [Halogeometricum sp. S3BR5-2]